MNDGNNPKPIISYNWNSARVEKTLERFSGTLQQLRMPMPLGVAIKLQNLDEAISDAITMVRKLKQESPEQ